MWDKLYNVYLLKYAARLMIPPPLKGTGALPQRETSAALNHRFDQFPLIYSNLQKNIPVTTASGIH